MRFPIHVQSAFTDQNRVGQLTNQSRLLFWRGGLKDIVAKTTLLGESGSAAIDVVLLILKNVNLL